MSRDDPNITNCDKGSQPQKGRELFTELQAVFYSKTVPPIRKTQPWVEAHCCTQNKKGIKKCFQARDLSGLIPYSAPRSVIRSKVTASHFNHAELALCPAILQAQNLQQIIKQRDYLPNQSLLNLSNSTYISLVWHIKVCFIRLDSRVRKFIF